MEEKAYPGQPELERWKNIYNVLFSDKEPPSPCKFQCEPPSHSTTDAKFCQAEEYFNKHSSYFSLALTSLSNSNKTYQQQPPKKATEQRRTHPRAHTSDNHQCHHYRWSSGCAESTFHPAHDTNTFALDRHQPASSPAYCSSRDLAPWPCFS